MLTDFLLMRLGGKPRESGHRLLFVDDERPTVDADGRFRLRVPGNEPLDVILQPRRFSRNVIRKKLVLAPAKS